MFKYNKNKPNTFTSVALGNFDGLHTGHRKVLQSALDNAKRLSLMPTILLFDTPPKKAVTGICPPILKSDTEREKELEKMGFCVVTAEFDKIRDMSPEEFVILLQTQLNARSISCGYNYSFGKHGIGNTFILQKIAARLGIEVSISPAVLYKGKPVSSTRIRKAIEDGNTAEANAMLGSAFSYSLEVIEGDARGRKLGFPTINQSFPDDAVRPRFGVYASRVTTDDGVFPGVTNIGIRPTIKTDNFGSETHIIGFDGNLYHKIVKVELLEFLRDESDFGSLEKLTAQISLDKSKAEKIYNSIITK